jgi:uncharacterized RDD family membrane protein YckC
LEYWGGSHYRLYYLYAFLPTLLFSLYYNVYLVRRLGGTPGKWLAGLKICKPDGSNIGYREATLRFLPELLTSLPLSIGVVVTTLNMTDFDYSSLSGFDRLVHMPIPFWYQSLSIFGLVWFLSELLVMMNNKKRRALHDFIAGTVVILRDPWSPKAVSSSEALLRERLDRA